MKRKIWKILRIKEYGPNIKPLFIQNALQLNIKTTNYYFSYLKPNAHFKAFVAYGEKQEPIGGICSQICTGPLPLIPDILKFGSIWGFWGEKSTLQVLIRKAVC